MVLMTGKYLKHACLIWAISFVFLAIVYFMVIKPQKENIDRINMNLMNLQSEAAEAKTMASSENIAKLSDDIDEMKAQLEQFVMLSKDEVETLAYEIIKGEISKQFELEEFFINTSDDSIVTAFNDCKYVSGQQMNVSFNASYEEFAVFLNTLERYKSTIFVDSFKIIRTPEENAKHKVEMTLAVLVGKQTPVDNTRS